MVEIIEEGAQLVIRIGEQEFARYNFGSNLWKPYLYPIRAANGLSLVADAPVDHRHHHGFWVGHGRVNGLDFWQERHNSGRIVHRSFEKVVSGGELGSFTEKCDWISPTGDVVLTDTRTFAFHDTHPMHAYSTLRSCCEHQTTHRLAWSRQMRPVFPMCAWRKGLR